jgi:hypothetical protein
MAGVDQGGNVRGGFAVGSDAGGAKHVGCGPGTGGVDDRPRGDLGAVGEADQEGCGVAAGGANPVQILAGDTSALSLKPTP